MLRIALAVACAAALAIGAAGCGGGDNTTEKNDYVKDVNAVQRRFVASANRLQSTASDPGSIDSTFRRLSRDVTRTADDLAAIEPPGNVERAHEKLVGQLRAYSRAIGDLTDGIAEETRRRQTAAARKVATETVDAGRDFSATIDEINRKLKE